MKKPTVSAALAALALLAPLLLAPSFAQAARMTPYLGLQGMGVVLDEARFIDSDGSYNIDFDPGYGAALQLGADMGESYPAIGRGRVEIELSHRTTPLDDATFAEGGVAVDGDMTLSALMVNTVGEADINALWKAYIGGGLGTGRLSMESAEVEGNPLVDDEDWVFAWQVGAGAALALGESAALDLGYRYLATSNPGFTDATGERVKGRYRSHSLMIGVRYFFR